MLGSEYNMYEKIVKQYIHGYITVNEMLSKLLSLAETNCTVLDKIGNNLIIKVSCDNEIINLLSYVKKFEKGIDKNNIA